MESKKKTVAQLLNVVFGIVLFGLSLPFVSGADEIIYTADTNTTLINAYGHTDRIESAQSFDSSAGGYVQRISVWMTNENAVTDDVIISLVEDSGGEPTGTVLDSTLHNVAGTTCTEYIWTLDETTQLSPATSYWVLFGRDGGADDYDYGLCGNEPGVYAGGTEADKDSGTWTDKDRDAYTEIALIDSPSPTPTSTTATSTELQAIHYDLLWLLWLIAFICAFLWFERYYKT